MKRILSLLLCLLALFCSTALCEEAQEMVSVTLPGALYADMDEAEIAAVAEASGFAGYELREDGSIGFTLTTSLQNQLLEAYELGLVESMAAYLHGEQRVPCFVSITPGDGYKVFDVMINKDKYTGMEYMCGITFLYGASFYQHFSGLPLDEVEVVVNFIDSKTRETIKSIAYSELF